MFKAYGKIGTFPATTEPKENVINIIIAVHVLVDRIILFLKHCYKFPFPT